MDGHRGPTSPSRHNSHYSPSAVVPLPLSSCPLSHPLPLGVGDGLHHSVRLRGGVGVAAGSLAGSARGLPLSPFLPRPLGLKQLPLLCLGQHGDTDRGGALGKGQRQVALLLLLLLLLLLRLLPRLLMPLLLLRLLLAPLLRQLLLMPLMRRLLLLLLLLLPLLQRLLLLLLLPLLRRLLLLLLLLLTQQLHLILHPLFPGLLPMGEPQPPDWRLLPWGRFPVSLAPSCPDGKDWGGLPRQLRRGQGAGNYLRPLCLPPWPHSGRKLPLRGAHNNALPLQEGGDPCWAWPLLHASYWPGGQGRCRGLGRRY